MSRCSKKGENIRNSINEDIYALIARKLMSGNETGGVIPQELVNWQSNTLTNRLPKFTTLSSLHDSAKVLLGGFKPTFHPNEAEINRLYDQVAKVWRTLLKQFDLFAQAINDGPSNIPKLRDKYLCLKASGQVVIFKAIRIALHQDQEVSLGQIISQLNQISWEVTNPLWQGIMVVDGRISATVPALDLMSRLIVYIIGIPFSDKEKEKLLKDFQKAKKSTTVTLPEKLANDAEKQS